MTLPPTTEWTGLAARTWDELGGDEPGPDYKFLSCALREWGGRSLDVGCGTGRLQLRLLADGLEVHGVDSSADMSAICRKKGDERGLNPIVFEQSMLALDLPSVYDTVFIACGSFMLLCDDASASAALASLRSVLAPEGRLVLSIFGPNDPPDPHIGEWQVRRTEQLEDGRTIKMEILCEAYDETQHMVSSRRRYTVFRGEKILEQGFLEDIYRWYAPDSVRRLLTSNGFEVVDEYGDWDSSPLTDQSPVAVFIALPSR